MMCGSRECFFNMGLTRAVLSTSGKRPDCREELTIDRTSEDTQSKMDLRRDVGMGSSGHVDGLRSETTLFSVSKSIN